MRPYETGATYVNFLEFGGATPERVRAAYAPEDWERLVELKDRYDPKISSASTATSRLLRRGSKGLEEHIRSLQQASSPPSKPFHIVLTVVST